MKVDVRGTQVAWDNPPKTTSYSLVVYLIPNPEPCRAFWIFTSNSSCFLLHFCSSPPCILFLLSRFPQPLFLVLVFNTNKIKTTWQKKTNKLVRAHLRRSSHSYCLRSSERSTASGQNTGERVWIQGRGTRYTQRDRTLRRIPKRQEARGKPF